MQRKKCKECDNPVWARGLCKYHDALVNPEKYSIKKSLLSSKKAKHIKPISDKQAKRLAEYRIIRDRFLEENNICEICGTSDNITLHHKLPRRYFLCDVSVFCTLCVRCHEKVHREDKWARENGWLIDHL